MSFQKDRGTILRITFDIVYPDGQMKTVAMSMADYDEWKNIGLIALNAEAVEKFVKPALEASSDTTSPVDVVKLFDTVESDADMKPAMMIVHNDSSVTVKCGAHRSRGHKEADNPVIRFM